MKKHEHWKGHIKAQAASGMSRSAYCSQKGLSASSFRYWLERLSDERQTSSGTFVSLSANGGALEVVIGRVVVRIPPGSDLTELRRVVEALS